MRHPQEAVPRTGCICVVGLRCHLSTSLSHRSLGQIAGLLRGFDTENVIYKLDVLLLVTGGKKFLDSVQQCAQLTGTRLARRPPALGDSTSTEGARSGSSKGAGNER